MGESMTTVAGHGADRGGLAVPDDMETAPL